ncbi:lysylphosphatidylglycerol synthase transmembrane domain-containing protein [Albibacterium sp.]|uniref:lysylphosphatidylglycerol synthase transmembrane domain-containing protein n=1 Tax=Albibacterium sp. TaxID=2952885 RepID=UPI002B63B3D4|nr:lysylphosphatidylglycerol synthase transmembrane domain-containing protein [Albibacterium sp.]HUH19321.1 lysylphosphatidylglycerol synthase transmembrane domain-containing protein [Albibacterium sp.]
MTKQKLWGLTKLILKIGITLVSLYLVFSKVSIKDLKEAITESDPIFFILAFIVFFISQVITSTRLNGIFKGVGLHISEKYNFKLYLLGMFYNLFLPGGIGGDGYKIFFLRRKFHIKGRRLLMAIFFDRLSGLWALCLITAALIIFIPQLQIPSWMPIALVLSGTLIYFVVLKKFFADYSQSLYLTHFKALCVQSLQLISAICLLYALHFDGKFSPYLFMFLVSSLVAIFPFTVGGLGAREVVFLYGADIFNLDPHLAVLISLLYYFIAALMSTLGTYFIFNPQALGEKELPQESDIEEKEED